MPLRSAPLLLLVLVMVALQGSCFGTSCHSMKYFYTGISEPSQRLPYFIAVGSVDGQIFVRYDSHSRRMEPQASWMEKVGREDPQYWEKETKTSRVTENTFIDDLEILKYRYNQSEGLHTLQKMFGCELCADRSKRGFYQLGYEGSTFIIFNPENLTWVAANTKAQITQRKWDADSVSNQKNKAYLEEICIEWLEKYLTYGKEMLQRTETPKVTVRSRSEVEDGMETHVCRVDGFYPREIDASWRRDGEVWLQDTFHGCVAPNADGTYHYWLSIQINPKERDRYRCHVEHDGLQEPLDLELKEPTDSKSNLGLIIGCIVSVLVLVVCVIPGTLILFKIRQDDYKTVPKIRQDDYKAVPIPRNLILKLRVIIIICIVAVFALCVIAGTLIFFQIRQDDYTAVPKIRQDDYKAVPKIRQDDKAVPKIRQDDKAGPSASSHSMKYFYTSISEPSQRLPHFVTLGFVDGQVFVHYDSHSRKVKPRVSWMEKFGKEDPKYWERETQRARGTEELFRESLEILRSRYNQSEGLHIIQVMYGCELRRDGSKGGFNQHGYDGRTFLTFDKETLTWVAPDPQAQITQRKWDAIPGENQGRKTYLEEICIEWLKKYVSYGNETLLRRETPKVTVSSRTEVEDGMEMHICRVHGFYPREINASWKRDGEVWLQDTFNRSVAPNADGTYHYWFSVRIDPKERDRYRCHVEHDSLQEPLDLELKEPTDSKSNLGLIIGCVVAALVLVAVIAGILLVFFKRRQEGYKATPTSDKGSNSSGQGSNQAI